MRRRAVLLVAIALVPAAGAALWWSARPPAAPAPWQGYAEADFVKLAPTEEGKLVAVPVHRGDQVAAGALVFAQDDIEDRAARDQAAAQLQQAEDQRANLQAPGKSTEIVQAAANLADARATRERAGADLARSEALVKTGAISTETFDLHRAEFRSADAKVAALEAALAQMRAPMGRPTEIATQQAAVAAARAALTMAQWRLDQRHVAAPAAGRIADVLARPGETVAAGTPVVSLLPPENIFVRFFVPEPQLARVHRGDAVTLACDNCPEGLRATISFVAPQAEYTPPLIYSEQSRAKLVYLVEARPPPAQAPLLTPGEPVQVRLAP